METAPIFIDDVLIVPRWELDYMKFQDHTRPLWYGMKQNCLIGLAIEQQEFSFRIGLVNAGNDIARIKLQTMNQLAETVIAVNASFSAGNIEVRYIDSLSRSGIRNLVMKEGRNDVRSCDFSTFTSILNPNNNFLQDGRLIIRMKAVFFIQTYSEYSSPLGSGLWTRDGDKDFVIVVQKDGEEEKTEIKVHKLVLAVRSHVFDRMLQTNMKEKREGKVIINDFGLEVVQSAVDFLYDRDQLDEKELDVLIGLLQFADKYEIFDLKLKLENVLRLRIFPDTIAKISNASITFNAACLNNYCKKIIYLYLESGTAFDGQDMDADFDIIPGRLIFC